MSEKHLDTEALDLLIITVKNYQVELVKNRQILRNAANVCDAAMGNDVIAKKYIKKMDDALELLKKASDKAGEVASALLEDRAIAVSVVDDI